MKKLELVNLIKEEVKKSNNQRNRFLKIFSPGKNSFQRIIKDVDPSVMEKLINFTESNGDEVEKYGKSAWAITKESGEKLQAVWSYNGRDLYYENPNVKSVYDKYLREF